MSKKYVPWLFALWFLFFLRVAGQFLVFIGHGGPLPPMEKWQSGLLPYSTLLASQILIILIMGKICLDFNRNQIHFSKAWGKSLLILGCIYLTAMVGRFFAQILFYPQAALIPVFFHWVLAAFLILVGTCSFKFEKKIQCKD